MDVRGVELDPWLVLRVAGPHPQTVLFHRSAAAEPLWRAHFRTCSKGLYVLHVRALMQRPWRSWVDKWSYHAGETPCAGTWLNGTLLQRHEMWVNSHKSTHGDTLCSTGMWYWSTDDPGSSYGHLLEEIHPAPYPNSTELRSMFRALQFSDSASMPRELASPPLVASLPPPASQLKVCLIGDSQQRTLLDGIVQLMKAADVGSGCGCEPPPSVACPKALGGAPSCSRPLCPSHNISALYTRSNFGRELLAEHVQDNLGKKCAVLLANTGHWWSSAKRKPTAPYEPRTPRSYGSEIASQMISLRNISRRWGTPVAWVASNPYPVNAGGPAFSARISKPYNMATCLTGERRFLQVLDGYNYEARRAAAEQNVDYIDTWEIALSLFDLSGDHAHYAWGDSPVARPQAARALNWIIRAMAQQRLPCLAKEPLVS